MGFTVFFVSLYLQGWTITWFNKKARRDFMNRIYNRNRIKTKTGKKPDPITNTRLTSPAVVVGSSKSSHLPDGADFKEAIGGKPPLDVGVSTTQRSTDWLMSSTNSMESTRISSMRTQDWRTRTVNWTAKSKHWGYNSKTKMFHRISWTKTYQDGSPDILENWKLERDLQENLQWLYPVKAWTCCQWFIAQGITSPGNHVHLENMLGNHQA